jgi:hypothetical protein
MAICLSERRARTLKPSQRSKGTYFTIDDVSVATPSTRNQQSTFFRMSAPHYRPIQKGAFAAKDMHHRTYVNFHSNHSRGLHRFPGYRASDAEISMSGVLTRSEVVNARQCGWRCRDVAVAAAAWEMTSPIRAPRTQASTIRKEKHIDRDSFMGRWSNFVRTSSVLQPCR